MNDNDSTSQLICSNCGNPLYPNQEFCTVCGQPVAKQANMEEKMVANPTDEQFGQGKFDPLKYATESDFNTGDFNQNQYLNQEQYINNQYDPNQMAPQGQYDPNQMAPQGQYDPNQMAQQGQYNPNQMAPQGQYDPNQMAPQGQYNPNQMTPQGQYDPNQMTPQGQYNPNQYQQPYPNYMNQGPMKPPKPPKTPEQKKKRNIIIAVCSAVGAVLLGLVIFLVYYNSYSRLDASKLYTYTFNGVNGKGYVDVSFDSSSDEYLKLDTDSTDAYAKILALQTIRFEVEGNENLKNGDKVTIKVVYDEDSLKGVKIKLKNTTEEVTVSGLEDASKIDLFEGVDLLYDGCNGYATATIDTESCNEFCYYYVTYNFDGDATNLSNGDKIKVTAEVSESDLISNKYEADTFEKEFTVAGLSEAVNYDVFKDITVVFEGVSPNLTAKVDTSTVEEFVMNNVQFSLDKEYGLKTGDVITVTAGFDDATLKSLGYVVTNTTKQVTVQATSEYLQAMTKDDAKAPDVKITEYLAGKLHESGEDYFFSSSCTELFGEGYIFKEIKDSVYGRYFLYNEEKDIKNNYIVLRKYTVTATNGETGKDESREIALQASISNIIRNADGSITFDEAIVAEMRDDMSYYEDAIKSSGYEVMNIEDPNA